LLPGLDIAAIRVYIAKFRDVGGGRFVKAERKVRTPQGRESSIK
jgi:hypothetical protein